MCVDRTGTAASRMRFDRCKVGETLFFSQKHLRCLGSRLASFAARERDRRAGRARKERRKEGRGKKTGRKGGRRRKEERKEERKEGRHERGRSGKRGNSLEIASGDLRWRERDGSEGPAWMDCEA